VAGTLQQEKQVQNLLGVRIDGMYLHFSYLNKQGQLKSVIAQVEGNKMSGENVGPYGMHDIQLLPVKIEGQRLTNN
jgi:hypothetical protein